MNHKVSLLSILIIILVFIAFNLVISGHYIHEEFTPDEHLYNSMAISISKGLNHFKYEDQDLDIGQEVTPFFSALVAGVYLIKYSIWSLYILHITISCLTIGILFLIIKEITGSFIVSCLSTMVFILYFPLWAYNYYVMMEIPTVFLLTITIYFIVNYFKENRLLHLVFSLALFSILVLLNNRFFVLLIVYLLFLLTHALYNRKLLLNRLFYAILIPVLIIGPWFARQYKVYDQFVFFTPLWNNLVSEKIGLFKPVDFSSIEDMSESFILQDYNYYLSKIEDGRTRFTNNDNSLTYEKFEAAIRDRDRIKNIYLARFVRYFTLYDKDYRFLYPDSYRMLSTIINAV